MCELVLPAQDGVLVRRPQRHVAAPGLASRPVDIGPVRDQELDRLRPSTTPDGVRDAEALVRVGAVLEQQPDVLQALVVEGMRECVRVRRLRTVLEQDPQTVRALRLGRVIDGLAVVRVRTGLQQGARQVGVVPDAGGTVERGHVPVLVHEVPVGVGATSEQFAGEVRRREARVARIDERRPAARASGCIRVTVPFAAENELHPRVLLELGPGGEHRLCPCTAPACGGLNEGLDALVQIHVST